MAEPAGTRPCQTKHFHARQRKSLEFRGCFSRARKCQLENGRSAPQKNNSYLHGCVGRQDNRSEGQRARANRGHQDALHVRMHDRTACVNDHQSQKDHSSRIGDHTTGQRIRGGTSRGCYDQAIGDRARKQDIIYIAFKVREMRFVAAMQSDFIHYMKNYERRQYLLGVQRGDRTYRYRDVSLCQRRTSSSDAFDLSRSHYRRANDLMPRHIH